MFIFFPSVAWHTKYWYEFSVDSDHFPGQLPTQQLTFLLHTRSPCSWIIQEEENLKAHVEVFTASAWSWPISLPFPLAIGFHVALYDSCKSTYFSFSFGNRALSWQSFFFFFFLSSLLRYYLIVFCVLCFLMRLPWSFCTVKNYKGSGIFVCLQTENVACYGYIKGGRRQETPEWETKDILTHGTEAAWAPAYLHVFLLLQVLQGRCKWSQEDYIIGEGPWGLGTQIFL